MDISSKQKLMDMMQSELMYMSNQLMKMSVQRDEALTRYQKLLTTFSHLLEKAIYYRTELGLPNDLGGGELWDYKICEEAGILDTGEITPPQDKQGQ